MFSCVWGIEAQGEIILKSWSSDSRSQFQHLEAADYIIDIAIFNTLSKESKER